MTPTLTTRPRPHHRRLRGIVATAAAVALGAALAACGSSSNAGASDSGSTIHVAYMPDVHGAGLIAIGEKQGYWKDAGITVDAKQFADGPTEIQAMASGDIDIAYIGPGATWMAATGRAVVVTADSLNIGDYLIGQSDISDLGQLKGAKVGYPEGTSGEMILRLALQKAGLTMSDIDAVPLDADAVVPAFVGGKIDVAAIWAPLSEEIRTRVPDANFLVSDKDFSDQYSFPQSWVASKDFVENHPDELQSFLQGFAASNDFRAKNLDKAVTITADYTKVDPKNLQAQVTTTTWLTSDQLKQAYENGDAAGWYENLEKLFVDMGSMDKSVPADDFTDFAGFGKAVAAAAGSDSAQ